MSGTLSRILKFEGVRGLFKGMAAPMIGVSAINAFLFGVYGFILDTLAPNHFQRTEKEHVATISHIFWAGCGSGFANSFISSPSELAKIKLQQQESQRIYKGPIHFFNSYIRTYGWRSGFQGMFATILRETPSYGVYFASFEWLSRRIEAQKDSSLTRLELMLAGGIAGVAGWVSTYPFDVAKTRIQASPPGTYRSLFQCMNDIYRTEGPRAFTRGLGATVLRAFPTNAVTFLVYKQTMDLL